MQPKTNSLLVGPTGSGKSYLSRTVAESFGKEVVFKSLTVAEWMVLGSGSSGARRTWNSIYDFVFNNHSKKGAVIFLDEIDKLTGTGDWSQHQRVEVFRLLDCSLPPDLLTEDDRKVDRISYEMVSSFLKNRTFIIAAGAFQNLWDGSGKRVGGFAGDREPESPSPDILSQHLARELVNRFRGDVVVIDALSLSDYESMLLTATDKMPPHLQDRFLAIGMERIQAAHRNQQGVRFLEEVIADVLAEQVELSLSPCQEMTSRWQVNPKKTGMQGLR